MNKKLTYSAIGILFLLAVWSHLALRAFSSPPPLPEQPQRIVSLAPSITETLYALGLGDNIIGVTRFCAYPPEAKNKPQIAGFGEVNFEAVVRLKPDLIVLPNDHINSQKTFERLGLPVLAFDTRSLTGFMQGLKLMGGRTGHTDEAEQVLKNFQESITAAQARACGKTPPRILFSVMHSYENNGYISEINVIGKDGFYDQLIKLAGGTNAYTGDLPFPRLSREALVYLNPDVIIDVIPKQRENYAAAMQAWQNLNSLNAVRNGRILLLDDEAHTVPGPRSYHTLNKLSAAFYPE